MAAITRRPFGTRSLSCRVRKGYQALFRTQKLPRKQKRPEDSSGRTFLQEKVYHSRQIFSVDELYRSQSYMIATQFCELKNRKSCK